MLTMRGAPVQFAPPEFAVELTDWIEYGILPDNDLLAAILRNDLSRTITLTADSGSSWTVVRKLWRWLHNFAPPFYFGSPQMVHRWEMSGGRNGCWRLPRPTIAPGKCLEP